MISNSSPLIFLAKINRLYIIKKLFNSVIIPVEVKGEILTEEKADSKIISKAIEGGWIKVDSLKNTLDLKLGKGESAAINLAKEKKDILIIDDASGAKAANSLGIKTIRTTTIILRALKNRIISKRDAIDLINKIIDFGYYISPKYYSQLITKLMESD